MNLEITGKLLDKGEIVQVKDTFRKREFVLELTEEINGSPYTNYAKMQLVQTKCDILDRFNEGDTLRVNFNIKGNRYERDGKVNYFSNLDAWRIEKADANSNNGGGQNAGSYNNNNNGGNNYNNGGGANNSGGGFNNNNGGGGFQNQNNANNGGGFQNSNSGSFQSSNSGGGNNSNNNNNNAGGDSDDLPF